MKKNVLIIVDTINGFVKEGALADKRIEKIVPTIESMVKEAIEKNIPIITFRDEHSINDEEFKIFPPHCIKGTKESELVEELKVYQDKFIDIPKNTTNGFDTDSFRKIMNSVYFENIFVVGCCTDICVENFVTSLNDYLNKNELNSTIKVVENAVDTFDSEKHPAESMNENSLNRMKSLEHVSMERYNSSDSILQGE